MEPARDGPYRGDRERSFERLYRRHRADVYRALLRELGNREDAEDVTQTAFLDAYRALTRGGRPERPRAWLLTIAENARRRRFRALRRGPTESSLEREPTAADAEVTVRELRDALERLPPNQRATLVLREVAGLSYAEIASRLRLSVPAVQMLLFRARRALRAELEADGVRGRAAGALAWPLPSWVAQALGSPGSPAGVLPRTAGIVAAAAVGTAVVAGTGRSRNLARTTAHRRGCGPSPLQRIRACRPGLSRSCRSGPGSARLAPTSCERSCPNGARPRDERRRRRPRRHRPHDPQRRSPCLRPPLRPLLRRSQWRRSSPSRSRRRRSPSTPRRPCSRSRPPSRLRCPTRRFRRRSSSCPSPRRLRGRAKTGARPSSGFRLPSRSIAARGRAPSLPGGSREADPFSGRRAGGPQQQAALPPRPVRPQVRR